MPEEPKKDNKMAYGKQYISSKKYILKMSSRKTRQRKVKLDPEKQQQLRTKEYECYKMSTKTECAKEERCLWDDSWWNVLFKNKCKSRLFHDLKINYPAKAKDYQKIVDTLMVLEGKKNLTAKEQIDLNILQEFRDDYVLFDTTTKKQAMNIYILEKLYESETDLKKKREIMKEINELRKTALQYIKETLLQKEVLYVVLASALFYYIGPMTVVNMSKEIFNFIKNTFGPYTIEELQQIANIQHSKDLSTIAVTNAKTAGKNATTAGKNATTYQIHAAKGFVDATGIGLLLTALSGLINPVTTVPIVATNVSGNVVNQVKDVWTFFRGNKDGKVRSRNSKIKKKK